MSAFGIETTVRFSVRIRVDRRPMSSTVPVIVPTRQNWPMWIGLSPMIIIPPKRFSSVFCDASATAIPPTPRPAEHRRQVDADRLQQREDSDEEREGLQEAATQADDRHPLGVALLLAGRHPLRDETPEEPDADQGHRRDDHQPGDAPADKALACGEEVVRRHQEQDTEDEPRAPA